ncbi:MAG: hypothetical protein ACI910_000137 [Oleispira sp.]|jgi:hypothetical protein
MLLSIMLIAVAAIQGLHDQSDHDALGSAAQCEFCLLSQHTEGGSIPFVISLPSLLVTQVHDKLLPFVSLQARNYTPPARAPPFVTSL